MFCLPGKFLDFFLNFMPHSGDLNLSTRAENSTDKKRNQKKIIGQVIDIRRPVFLKLLARNVAVISDQYVVAIANKIKWLYLTSISDKYAAGISNGKRPLTKIAWGGAIFTGLIQSLSCNVCESCICLYLCAIAKTPLHGGMETSGQRAYRLYWHTSRHFCILTFSRICLRFDSFFWFLLSLLCIIGELAGGGSVVVGF